MARQGGGELETGPAAGSLGQGLRAPGGRCGVLGLGQAGGALGRMMGTVRSEGALQAWHAQIVCAAILKNRQIMFQVTYFTSIWWPLRSHSLS